MAQTFWRTARKCRPRHALGQCDLSSSYCSKGRKLQTAGSLVQMLAEPGSGLRREALRRWFAARISRLGAASNLFPLKQPRLRATVLRSLVQNAPSERGECLPRIIDRNTALSVQAGRRTDGVADVHEKIQCIVARPFLGLLVVIPCLPCDAINHFIIGIVGIPAGNWSSFRLPCGTRFFSFVEDGKARVLIPGQ
jgi:hypothetical protein